MLQLRDAISEAFDTNALQLPLSLSNYRTFV
jgi:hypothetical protein